MKHKNLNEIETIRMDGDKFETQAHMKEGFKEKFKEDLNLSVDQFFFAPGERTTSHTHTIRQILFITGGKGIVASEDQRFEVSAGDLISIPPNLDHWHGATPNSFFSHIAIVLSEGDEVGTLSSQKPAKRRSK